MCRFAVAALCECMDREVEHVTVMVYIDQNWYWFLQACVTIDAVLHKGWRFHCAWKAEVCSDWQCHLLWILSLYLWNPAYLYCLETGSWPWWVRNRWVKDNYGKSIIFKYQENVQKYSAVCTEVCKLHNIYVHFARYI